MDYHDTFQPLNNAILGQSQELAQLFSERWADWYSHALSDIALLTYGSEVRFADTALTGDDPDLAYSVRIAVFTDQLVIMVTAQFDSDGERHTTRAISRAGLKSLEVAAGTGALGNTLSADWPGKVRAKLDYGDAEPLMLPGGKRPGPEQYARLAALLPSLIADLTATQGAH